MKKGTIIALLFIGIALGTTSCLNTDMTGNTQSFGDHPAVVNRNIYTGSLTFLSSYGLEIIIPAESQVGLTEGQCVLAQFVLDYDNQPNPNYYTAQGAKYKTVEQDPVYIADSIFSSVDRRDNFTAPIEAMAPAAYDPIMHGKIFFQLAYIGSKDRTVNYRMYLGRDSINAQTGARNLYLLTSRDDTTTAAVTKHHAFDFKPLIDGDFGRDSTFTIAGEKIYTRYIRVHLNYLEKVDNGVPVFKQMNATPLEIFVYK
ncbi:hypothetical protein AGMMS50262_03580 [Bacteroidia bacterium]|nr:hypothetical protein AGMMS50262_03580 [Bacteroidia bacterium]